MSQDLVTLPIEGLIDFNQTLVAPDGSPLKEEYFPLEHRERGEELTELLRSTGSLTREEAKELQGLKRSRERTLGRVCVNLLYNTFQGDKADGTEKMRRHKLAMKIDSDDDEVYPKIQMNSEKKKIILTMAEKATLPTIVYARVHEALEGAQEDDE
jgi:hypothetical protein